MPETPLQQLSQVSGGGMVPEAAGNNQTLSDMFRAMLSNSQQKQGYLEQQQQAYNKDLERYAQMVEQQRTDQTNEAGRWGAMANAASSVAPEYGNLGAMLGKVGGAYAGQLAGENAQALKNQGDLAKMRQAEVRSLEARDQNAMLMKSLMGGNKGMNPVVKVVDGKLIKFDPLTNTTEVLSGSQDQIKANLFKTFFAAAVKNEVPDPETYAQAQTERALANFGGTTVKGETNQIPGTTSSKKPVIGPTQGAQLSHIDEGATGQLSPEDQVLAERLIARINTNPAAAKNDIARLEQIMAKYNAPEPSPTSVAPPAKAAPAAPITYIDQPKREGAKESSKEGAKMYAESFNTDVLKPLQSFQDTGRIMQDFNNLGAMNVALKNGKLKEFMAGETGKWAMSFLPENSDLRKGISNAQEAEKLSAGMINKILNAAKGVQTEGDAQRARSQITSVGTDPDANKYLEAYINETARQLKMREQSGLQHKQATGNWEGYDNAWQSSPIMKEAKGSVKKLGTQWIGLTQYIEKFQAKNPGAEVSDAVASWNKVK